MDWGSCLEPPNDYQKGVPTLRCIPIVFYNVIRAGLIFCGIVALFMIIWAGFNMVNSGGDPKKVESARHIMTFAIIGLVIVLMSFGIIFFIGYITNSSSCITNFSDPAKFLTGC